MAFQIKDFASISASMINWMRSMQKKVTDFTVGSVARTMLEAPAIEIEELYMRMFLGLKEAIPVAIYRSFDFQKLTATASTGIIRLNVASSASVLIIPAGTVFQPDGYTVTFTSAADVMIAAGNTQADIVVSASTAGTVGNIPAGVSMDPVQTITGFVSASSLYDFRSGTDDETDAQQKIRFAAYIATLNRGTVAALKYGLSLAYLTDASGNVTERVVYRQIVEPWLTDVGQPVALVKAYIHNGTSGASLSLLARAQEVIDGYYDSTGAPVAGWKAAGVKVQVIAATTATTNVSGTLTVALGYQSSDVQSQVVDAISNYIAQLDIGADVLVSEIYKAAMEVAGVVNFIPSSPTVDVVIAATAKAMPGTITITVA